jgi:hypothetical protein
MRDVERNSNVTGALPSVRERVIQHGARNAGVLVVRGMNGLHPSMATVSGIFGSVSRTGPERITVLKGRVGEPGQPLVAALAIALALQTLVVDRFGGHRVPRRAA